MSFYKALASWATKMEEGRMERKRSSYYGPLKRPDFHNAMQALEGGIGKMFEMAGHIINQHVSACTSDLATVTKNLLDEFADKQQAWLDASLRLYENIIKGFFDAFNSAAELRHKEAEYKITNCQNAIMDAENKATKRQNAIMKVLVQLYKQTNTLDTTGFVTIANHVSRVDLANSERYLEMMERIRVVDVKGEQRYAAFEERFDTLMNTMSNFYLSLLAEAHKKQRVVYRDAPSLPWMIENADGVIEFADALRQLRDNTVPADTAQMYAIRTIRSMMDVSIQDVLSMLNAKYPETDINLALAA